MPFLPPNQQRQSTEGKIFNNALIIILLQIFKTICQNCLVIAIMNYENLLRFERIMAMP